MDTVMDAAIAAITRISGDLLDLALVILAMGTISMTIVEVFKGVLRLRYVFHRYYFSRWLRQNRGAHDQLLQLAAGARQGDAFPWAFGELATENVFSRVRGAAQCALDFPGNYKDLFAFLVDGTPDAAAWLKVACAHRIGAHSPAQPGDDAAGDIRVRLGTFVERRLDVVEADAQWWWSKYNQASALVVSVMLFTALFVGIAGWSPTLAFLFSLFGGILAPFAKDIVSRLTEVHVGRASRR
jgi:hypothetical protein